jgi:N4-gp56 family major capsid protein
MARIYGTGGVAIDGVTTASSIGAQTRTDFYYKKALIAVRDKQYFMPLADVRAMPKHHGKKIKQDVYHPILDDKNTNDQGIDADKLIQDSTKFMAWDKAGVLKTGGTGFTAATATTAGFYATSGNATTAAAAGGYIKQMYGNIYGSAKDIGVIAERLPALSETGGRVNRVGMTRTQIEGSIVKQGFFTEYTQESLDFDSDSELMSHITEEMVVGATELTEAALQVDLLNKASSAGTVRYTGSATTKATTAVVADYDDLMNLSIDLDNAKCPKQTKIISGSRMTDTKTVNGGRVMYIGPDLIPMVRKMKGIDTSSAVGSGFVGVEKYADASNILNGEIGSIDQFRIIVVPEMLFDGGGGDSSKDIYPMLVVGDGAFTTIGFQTDGKTVKFTTTHKKPGKDIADLNDPYGEKGFYSIKWYYGFMALRPERLGIIWSTKV